MLTVRDLSPGRVLARVGPPLTQRAFCEFGLLLGTDAPIHVDPDYARASGFGGTIAQGMLLTAPYEVWLRELFSDEAWSRGGSIEVRFRGPAWAGEQVAMTLAIVEVADGRCDLRLESRCGDRILLTGSASITLQMCGGA